ncbi:hypothetical protein BH24ACT15_BH24ACT15_36100 [soil metagenome]
MGPVRHSRPPSEPTPGDERERGAALVLMTVTISALLVVCTLVIDGSQAYPQRRKAQNAADEAAVAATRALDRWKIARFQGTSGSDVQATAESVVEDNGAELEACTIIRGNGSEIGPCTSATGDPNAAGVEVEASETRSTSFGDIVEQDSITARTSAAATSQPLISAGSPFVLCGNKNAPGGSKPPYDLLDDDDDTKLDPDKVAGHIAAKTQFILQGSQVHACGAPSSKFKGKVGDPQNVSLDTWTDIISGNGQDADIETQVLGAKPCVSPPYQNCDILIPIANAGGGTSTRPQMFVVAWAVFRIRVGKGGTEEYVGELVGVRPYASGGGTSDGVPTREDVRVIRLIE